MRNPNHIVTLDTSNSEDFEYLKLTTLEPVNQNIYDLMDEKDIKKYFSDIEKRVRNSFQYKK